MKKSPNRSAAELLDERIRANDRLIAALRKQLAEQRRSLRLSAGRPTTFDSVTLQPFNRAA